jgi:hypothetical protein
MVLLYVIERSEFAEALLLKGLNFEEPPIYIYGETLRDLNARESRHFY